MVSTNVLQILVCFVIATPYILLVLTDRTESKIADSVSRLEVVKLKEESLQKKLQIFSPGKQIPLSHNEHDVMIAEIAKQIIDSKQKLDDLANQISALEASSQPKVNPSPSPTPTSYVEQTPAPTQSKSNLYQTSVPENFKPSFEFNNYKNKSFEEMINDYIIYHNQMTSGLIPPRYLFLEIGSNVGTEGYGNRVERVAWCFLLSLLSSRAFLLKFVDSYDVSNTYFLPPGFDWNYHQKPEFLQLKQVTHSFGGHAFETEYFPSYFKEEVMTFDGFERIFEQPGSSIFSNENFKHSIPNILGNWKATLLRFIFSKPIPAITNEVENLKSTIRAAGYNKIMTVQFRSWGYTQAVTPTDVTRYTDCMRFLGNETDRAYFLATDNLEVREYMKKEFGSKLFTMDVRPEGPNVVEFTKNADQSNRLSGTLGALVDWWMLGEGDMIIHTAASSYGISAADRGLIWKYPNRFVMGGLTQCVNPKQQYYLEKIYKSPLETYQDNGRIVWIPFIQ